MTNEKETTSTPKSYIYVPGKARLSLNNNQIGPPDTEYEDRKVILCRDDVIQKITKRSTEPNDTSDN